MSEHLQRGDTFWRRVWVIVVAGFAILGLLLIRTWLTEPDPNFWNKACTQHGGVAQIERGYPWTEALVICRDGRVVKP